MKFLFVIAVALFGLFMFVAGTLAPEDVKTPTARLAREVLARLPFSSPSSPPVKAEAKPADDGKKDATPPVPMETLLLPTPLPAQGQYALQVGQFGNADSAEILLQRVKAAGIAARKIAAVDAAGQAWWIVAAGSYAQPDDARTLRPTVAKDVGAVEEMPVILLPAAAAPLPSAPATPVAKP